MADDDEKPKRTRRTIHDGVVGRLRTDVGVELLKEVCVKVVRRCVVSRKGGRHALEVQAAAPATLTDPNQGWTLYRGLSARVRVGGKALVTHLAMT